MGRFNRESRSGERGGGNRFDGGGFGGGRREFGGRRNFGNRDSGRSEMFMTVCDECGKDCEVPFKPTQGKPVYCSECFEERGNDRRDFSNPRPSPDFRRPESRDFGRENRESKGGNDNGKLLEQFASLNSKLDRILNALESKNQPTTAAKIEGVAKKAEIKTEKKEKNKEKALSTKESKPKKAATKRKPTKKSK